MSSDTGTYQNNTDANISVALHHRAATTALTNTTPRPHLHILQTLYRKHENQRKQITI